MKQQTEYKGEKRKNKPTNRLNVFSKMVSMNANALSFFEYAIL